MVNALPGPEGLGWGKDVRSWDERVGRFPGEGTVSGNFREAEAREITGIDNGAHAGRGGGEPEQETIADTALYRGGGEKQ